MKRKNRRLPRNYVLEVKLSASQRRRNRLRRFTLLLGTMALTLLIVFILWQGSEMLVRRFLFENLAFSIRRLEIITDGVFSTEQLRTWAGVKLGANLLALDLTRVDRDLRLVPAIESVVVERILPGTLVVRVTEREPIAQVLLPRSRAGTGADGDVYLLDANGYFMFPIENAQRAVPVPQANDRLPILTGLPARDLRPGKQSEAPRVRAALELVKAFERSPMAGLVDLKQIDVATSDVLVVSTGQGNEISFGLTDFDTQLRRWRLVHDCAVRSSKHITSLDLAVANNAPLIWTDVNSLSPPPPPPKPIKASPYKKKHV
jgi:cell division septal protein FtsQ